MSLKMKTSNKRPRENSSFLNDSHDHDHRHHHGYECKTCRKSFATYQALGGHQGIHKKIKSGDENDECRLTLNIVAPKYSELHRCKLCKKGFCTGQALGGHMTLHRLEKDLILMEAQEIINNNLINLEVKPLRMMKEEDYKRCSLKRDELILAAKEWRLSI